MKTIFSFQAVIAFIILICSVASSDITMMYFIALWAYSFIGAVGLYILGGKENER
jgi:hypothetical protein